MIKRRMVDHVRIIRCEDKGYCVDVEGNIAAGLSTVRETVLYLGELLGLKVRVEEWFSMDSAPRDGTPFLAIAEFSNGEKRMVTVRYNYAGPDRGDLPYGPFCWDSTEDGASGYAERVLVKWTHLPEMPKEV